MDGEGMEDEWEQEEDDEPEDYRESKDVARKRPFRWSVNTSIRISRRRWPNTTATITWTFDELGVVDWHDALIECGLLDDVYWNNLQGGVVIDQAYDQTLIAHLYGYAGHGLFRTKHLDRTGQTPFYSSTTPGGTVGPGRPPGAAGERSVTVEEAEAAALASGPRRNAPPRVGDRPWGGLLHRQVPPRNPSGHPRAGR